MAELARTPAGIRRLFRMVDLAPMPHADILGTALNVWQAQRGADIAPRQSDLLRHWPERVRDASFLARPRQGSHADFDLHTIGPDAAPALSGGGRLSELADRRLAVRLRHLFSMVLQRGEAATVEFTDRGRNFEIFAAPVTGEGGETTIFAALACDEMQARG